MCFFFYLFVRYFEKKDIPKNAFFHSAASLEKKVKKGLVREHLIMFTTTSVSQTFHCDLKKRIHSRTRKLGRHGH